MIIIKKNNIILPKQLYIKYADNEISECRMRFVGRLDIKELKIEDLAF